MYESNNRYVPHPVKRVRIRSWGRLAATIVIACALIGGLVWLGFNFLGKNTSADTPAAGNAALFTVDKAGLRKEGDELKRNTLMAL